MYSNTRNISKVSYHRYISSVIRNRIVTDIIEMPLLVSSIIASDAVSVANSMEFFCNKIESNFKNSNIHNSSQKFNYIDSFVKEYFELIDSIVKSYIAHLTIRIPDKRNIVYNRSIDLLKLFNSYMYNILNRYYSILQNTSCEADKVIFEYERKLMLSRLDVNIAMYIKKYNARES